jgi:hypothetical protein
VAVFLRLKTLPHSNLQLGLFCFVWHQNGSVGKQNQIKMKIFDSHELMRRIEVVKLFGCVWHQNGSVAKQNQTKASKLGKNNVNSGNYIESKGRTL